MNRPWAWLDEPAEFRIKLGMFAARWRRIRTTFDSPADRWTLKQSLSAELVSLLAYWPDHHFPTGLLPPELLALALMHAATLLGTDKPNSKETT